MSETANYFWEFLNFIVRRFFQKMNLLLTLNGNTMLNGNTNYSSRCSCIKSRHKRQYKRQMFHNSNSNNKVYKGNIYSNIFYATQHLSKSTTI